MKKLSSLLLVLLLFGVLGSSNLLALAPPTTQAGYLNFTLQEANPSEVPLSFVRGNGTNRLVVISTTAFTATDEPTDDIAYTAPASGNLADVTDEITPGYYVIGNLSGTNQSMTLKGLAEGTTYYVKVFEYNTNGVDYSYNNAAGVALNPRDFTTLYTIDGPILVGTDQIKTVSARMTWDALAELGAGDYYNLYLHTANNFSGVTPINVGGIGTDPRTWVENGLTHNTTYYWTIRAVIDGYEYANSRVENFTTATAPVIQIVSIAVSESMIIGDADGNIDDFWMEIRFNQPMEPSTPATWEFGANNPLTDGIFDLLDYSGTWVTTAETDDTYRIVFDNAGDAVDQTIEVDYCVDVNVTAVETADGVRDWNTDADVYQISGTPERGKTNVFCIDTEYPTFFITYERTSPNATTTPKWVKNLDAMKVTATFSEPMDISYTYSMDLNIATVLATIVFSVVPDTDNMVFTANFAINDATAQTWVTALAVANGQDVNGNTLSVANNNLVPEGGVAGDDAALILDNVVPFQPLVTFPAPGALNPDWFKFGAGNSTLNQTLKTVTGSVTDGNGWPLLMPVVNGGILNNVYTIIYDINGNGNIDTGTDYYWNASTQAWELLTLAVWVAAGYENPANGTASWNFTFPTVDTYGNTTPDGSYIFWTQATDLAYNKAGNPATIALPSDPWTQNNAMQIWLDNTAPILSIEEPELTSPVQMFNAEASGTPGSIYDIVVDGLVTEQGSGLQNLSAELDLPHIAPGIPYVAISGFADLNGNMMHDVGEPFFQMIDAVTYGFMSTTERLYSAEVTPPSATGTDMVWELSPFQVFAITNSMVTYALANSQADLQFVLTAKVVDGVGHTTTKKTAVRLDAKPPVGDVTYYVQKQGIGAFELKTANFHVRDLDVVRIDANFNEDMKALVPVNMDEATPLWDFNPRTLARVDAQNYTHDWLVQRLPGADGVSDFTFVSGEDMYGNIVLPAIAGGKGTWVTVDNTIPLLSIVTPDPRANVTEALLLNHYKSADFNGTITGTAFDALPGQLKDIKVRVFRDINRDGTWQSGEPFYDPNLGYFDAISSVDSWIDLPAVANWTLQLPNNTTHPGYWTDAQRNNRAYVVEAYSEDLAGNVSIERATAFVIDDTPPVISVLGPLTASGSIQGPIELEVDGADFNGDVEDANGGTIADIQITLYYDVNCNGYQPAEGDAHFDKTDYTTIATISIDPDNYSNPLPYRSGSQATTNVDWDLDALLTDGAMPTGAGDGCYVYVIEAYDQAGNAATSVNGFWVIDQTDPTVTMVHHYYSNIINQGNFIESNYVKPGAAVRAEATFDEFIVYPDPANAGTLPVFDYVATDGDYDTDPNFSYPDPPTDLPPYAPNPGNWYLQDQVWLPWNGGVSSNPIFSVPVAAAGLDDMYTISAISNVVDLAGNDPTPLSAGTLYIDATAPEADITHINGVLVTTPGFNWNFGPNRLINSISGTANEMGAGPSGLHGVQIGFELLNEDGDPTGRFWTGSGFAAPIDNSTDDSEVLAIQNSAWTGAQWSTVTPTGPALDPYSTWIYTSVPSVPEFGDHYQIAIHVRAVDKAENANSTLEWMDSGSPTNVGTLSYETIYWDPTAPVAVINEPTDAIAIATPMGNTLATRNVVQQVGGTSTNNPYSPDDFPFIGGIVSDVFTTTDVQVAVVKLTDCNTDEPSGLWWDEVGGDFGIVQGSPHWFNPTLRDDGGVLLAPLPFTFDYEDGTAGALVHEDVAGNYIYWTIEEITLDDDADAGCYAVFVRGIDAANNYNTYPSAGLTKGYFELQRQAPEITSIAWAGHSYPAAPTTQVWYKDGDDLTVTTTYDQGMFNSAFSLGALFTNQAQTVAGPNNVWEYGPWTVSASSGTYTYTVGTPSENFIDKQADSDLTGINIVTVHVDNAAPLAEIDNWYTTEALAKASPVQSVVYSDFTGDVDELTADAWQSGVFRVYYQINRMDGALPGLTGAGWAASPATYQAAYTAGNTTWSIPSGMNFHDINTSQRTYTLTVWAEDNVGNVQGTTSVKYFTVDAVNPVVTLTNSKSTCDGTGFIGRLNDANTTPATMTVTGTVTDHVGTTLGVSIQSPAGYLQADLATWGATQVWLNQLTPGTTPATADGIATVNTSYAFTSALYTALNTIVTTPTTLTVTVRATDVALNVGTATCSFNFMPVRPEGEIDFIVGGTSIITTIPYVDNTDPLNPINSTLTFATAKSGTPVAVVSEFYNPTGTAPFAPQLMDAVAYDYSGHSSATNVAASVGSTPAASGWAWTYATPTGDGITEFTFNPLSGNTRDQWGNPVGDIYAQNLPEGELIIDNTVPEVCDISVLTAQGVTTLAHEHEARNTVKLLGTMNDYSTLTEFGFVKDLFIAVRNINVNKFWQGMGVPYTVPGVGPFYPNGSTINGTLYPPNDGRAYMNANTIHWIKVDDVTLVYDGSDYHYEWEIPFTLTEFNEDGVYHVYVYAEDYAGNVINTFATPSYGGGCNEIPEFRLDNTAPVITLEEMIGDIENVSNSYVLTSNFNTYFAQSFNELSGIVTDNNGNTVELIEVSVKQTAVEPGEDDSNVGSYWNGSGWNTPLDPVYYFEDTAPVYLYTDGVTNESYFDWDVDISNDLFVSGHYEVCLYATDLAGNRSLAQCYNIIVDYTNPFVTILSPGNFTEDIPVNLPFASIKFSEEIQAPAGTDLEFTMYEFPSGTMIRQWDMTDVVFVSPNEVRLPLTVGDLAVGTWYWITTNGSASGTEYTNDIRDLVGNEWDKNELYGGTYGTSKWKFRTASDVTPPVAEILVNNGTNWIDVNGSSTTGIRRDQNLRIQFDEKVRKSNGFSYNVGSAYVNCGAHRYNTPNTYYELIDANGPTIEMTKTVSGVEVAFTDFDAYFAFNGSSGAENEIVIEPTVLLDASTTYTVYISGNVVDYAGNALSPSLQYGSFTTGTAMLAVPNLAIVGLTANGCYNDADEFSVTSTSVNPGVYSEYSTDGVNWDPFSMGATYDIADFFMGENGTRTLYFRDAHCGNDGYATTQVTFIVDNTLPTAAITRTSGSPTNVGPMVFTMTVTETNTYNTITSSAFSVVNGTIPTGGITNVGNVYTINVNPTSPSPQTGHTVSLTLLAGAIVDCAANASIVTPSANGVYDDVAPVITIDAPLEFDPLFPTANGYNASFEYSSNETLVSAEYSWNGTNWYTIPTGTLTIADLTGTGEPVVDGTYTLYVRGEDAAGNEGTDDVTFVIDVTPPAWCTGTPDLDFDYTITKTKAAILAGLNEAGTVYYIVQEATMTAPSAATIFGSGTPFMPLVSDCDGDPEDYQIEFTGLTAGTDYVVYLIAEDYYGNQQVLVEEVEFSTMPVPAPHSNLYVAGRTLSTITLKWTKTTDSDVFIVAKQGSAVNFDEDAMDGMTFNADADFASGHEFDVAGDGNFVIYAGSGNIMTVRQLSANTVYHFALYAVSTDGNLIYNTGQKLTISQRTLRKEGIEDDGTFGTPSLSISNLRPNPATTDLTFDLEVFEQTNVKVEVINAAGQVVAIPIVSAQYGDGIYPIQIVLDSEKVASGAYYLKVTANGSEIAIAPFSVVR